MAGITYPPGPASLLPNDVVAVNRFLQQPIFVSRALQTLAELRFVGTKLLKGRAQTTGGAIGYELVQGIFADNDPKIVAPGSEYPLTITQDGPAQLALVTKRGEDAIITDEAIHRRLMDPVTRGMLKLVNSVGRQVDQIVISAIASMVTATKPAFSPWSGTGATPRILQDIMLARAQMAASNLGYNPDMLLVDDLSWAYLSSDPTISNAMARETAANPVYTGKFGMLAGLEVVAVPAGNLPGGLGANAWVLDSNALGFIAFETLGGGYQAAGDLIESKVMRIDDEDSWRIRGRSNFVPAVTDPLAGLRISGVA